MQLHLYFLVNDRTKSVVRLCFSRSDAEACVSLLPVLTPLALSINSSTLWHVADFDDVTMEISTVSRRLVDWNTTDYETTLPSGVLRSLKKVGALPSSEPVVDADVINERLERIEEELKK